VQFYHKFSPQTMKGVTYAVPDVSLESMLKTMLSYASNPQQQYILFGKAVTHPKDQFCRKVGNQIAKAKAKKTEVSLVEYKYIENECRFIITLKDETILVFSGRFDKPNLHLIMVAE